MSNNTIIYSKEPITPLINLPPPKILPRLRPQAEDISFIIYAIGAAAYHLLATKVKSENIELFVILIRDIDA